MHSIIQNLDLSARGIWFPISVGLLLLFFALFMPKRRINVRFGSVATQTPISGASNTITSNR